MIRMLSEEGQKMFDNLMQYEELARLAEAPPPLPPKVKKVKVDPLALENDFLRQEIRKMIYNSRLVINDCKAVISTYTTMKEYLSSDAKVAMTIHTNNIKRLKRILELMPAFKDISLPNTFDYDEYIAEQDEGSQH